MLIKNPMVHIVAESTLLAEALADWSQYNGLEAVANSDSPLGSLLDAAYRSDDPAERLIEFAGRHCYRSWARGRGLEAYIRNLIDVDHGSVFEHATLSFAIQGVSRSLTHELVRHRVGVAISQESQRYVDAGDINFVVPPLLLFLAKETLSERVLRDFEEDCNHALASYTDFQLTLLAQLPAGDHTTTFKKRVNEAARAALPNAAETRLTWTANVRTLRHFFEIRGADPADLEIRRLACELLTVARQRCKIVFDDFTIVEGSFGVPMIVKVQDEDISND